MIGGDRKRKLSEAVVPYIEGKGESAVTAMVLGVLE